MVKQITYADIDTYAQKLKGDLIKRHIRSKGSSNLNIGYNERGKIIGDTKKAPPNEAIASPLVIPTGSVFNNWLSVIHYMAFGFYLGVKENYYDK